MEAKAVKAEALARAGSTEADAMNCFFGLDTMRGPSHTVAKHNGGPGEI
jgi:hypothetical protein